MLSLLGYMLTSSAFSAKSWSCGGFALVSLGAQAKRASCQQAGCQEMCTWPLCCAQDVAVSVVGKYRYFMHSPAQHDSVPVIVDIILVGRTKIITLHSGIWLENRTDRRVSFRLHVPITPLVAPVAEAAAAGPSGGGGGGGPPERSGAPDFKTDATVGPLSPDEGAALACFARPEALAGT